MCIVFILFVSTGCGTAHPPSSPGIPPRVDPGLEAQVRVLRAAKTASDEGRYSVAARLLKRFIDTYPQSSQLPEARWSLAQAYEKMGDFPAARTEYRSLVTTIPMTADTIGYQEHALRRLNELRQEPAEYGLSRTRVALALSPRQLPPKPDLESWMRMLVSRGVTTLVLDVEAGPGSPESAPGVYFQTDKARVVDDLFGQMIPLAHQVGMALFGFITLQEMARLGAQPEWRTMEYEFAARQFRPSSTLDLLNPAVQDYLIGLMTDLAQTGIDGMLVRVREAKGFSREVSGASLRQFENSLGVKLEPERLFGETARSQTAFQDDANVEYWRWVGWKARERLRLLERMREASKRHLSSMPVVIMMHPEAVMRPVAALEEYGEDFLEIKRKGFEIALSDSSNDLQAAREGEALVRRTIELVGGQAQFWVMSNVQANDLSDGTSWFRPRDQELVAAGIHVLLRVASPRAIP
ncbi:MAG: tetratricopeptide repeat protein [Nitrospiraceae bacterium]